MTDTQAPCAAPRAACCFRRLVRDHDAGLLVRVLDGRSQPAQVFPIAKVPGANHHRHGSVSLALEVVPASFTYDLVYLCADHSSPRTGGGGPHPGLTGARPSPPPPSPAPAHPGASLAMRPTQGHHARAGHAHAAPPYAYRAPPARTSATPPHTAEARESGPCGTAPLTQNNTTNRLKG